MVSGHTSIENMQEECLTLRRGTQAARVTKPQEMKTERIKNCKVSFVKKAVNSTPLDEVLYQARSFTQRQKKDLHNVILENEDVIGGDLPGYNGCYGPVTASLEFTTLRRQACLLKDQNWSSFTTLNVRR